MPRFPQPFYRPSRRLWYVQIGKKQHMALMIQWPAASPMVQSSVQMVARKVVRQTSENQIPTVAKTPA